MTLAATYIMYGWFITNGLPYNSDANESFSAYVQGQNMLNFGPTKNFFLPDDAPGKHISAHPYTYTHGPNLPRYFSCMMSLLGIKSISYQILFSSFVSLLLSSYFIVKSFPEIVICTAKKRTFPFFFLILALFCTDFLGTLQFIVNLWRTWHFPLFWGCVWAVRMKTDKRLATENPNLNSTILYKNSIFAKGKRQYINFIIKQIIVFLLFFLLFQLEFLFALFTFCSCLGYYVWENRAQWKHGFGWYWITMISGSLTSLGVFVAQLISFYGLKGLLFDLKITYIARNTNKISWESIKNFYELHSVMMWPSTPSWDFRYPVFLKVTFANFIDKLSISLTTLCFISLLVAFAIPILFKRILILQKYNSLFQVNKLISPLLWAMVVTYLLLGLIIPGYTLNGYVYRWAPLLVFPITLALSILVVNLSAAVTAFMQEQEILMQGQLYPLIIFSMLVLSLWLLNSVTNYYKFPHFKHTPAKILAKKYKGHSFVSGTTFPHMISYYTNKWSYYSPMVFPGDQQLDQTSNWNADRKKNREYETPEYYLCETLPYNKYLNCGDIIQQMIALGHSLVDKGDGYYIVKLNWNLCKHFIGE